MPRARSPNRDIAKNMYLESNGTMKLKDIAGELGLKDSQIRKWKSQDKWEQKLKGALPKRKSNVTKRKQGAQYGNKNAVGNGPPEGNKNAVTTGEFESIFFDTLEDDELELIQTIKLEKRKLLEQEIQLLTVRERRMLKRISELRQSNFTVVEIKTDKGIGPMGPVDKTDEKQEGTLGQIQRIEDALTRVQDKKAKLISELHKWEMDHEKIELEKSKVSKPIDNDEIINGYDPEEDNENLDDELHDAISDGLEDDIYE